MTATILQFPKRNKGRVRKTESIFAAGEMALGARGIEAPENVVRPDSADEVTVYAEDTTALLAIALYSAATEDFKRQVRTQVSIAHKCATTRQKRQIAARLRSMLA